jgi:hypothetical protein
MFPPPHRNLPWNWRSTATSLVVIDQLTIVRQRIEVR